MMTELTDTSPRPAPPRFSVWMVVLGLFRALTGAHALSIYLILGARALTDERNNLLMFFDETIHLGVVPSVGLLPLCLLLRRWGLALFLLPIVVTCGLWYGPRLLPTTVPPADGPVISVLTYNIAGLNDNGRDWGPVVTEIIAADADLVALQELSPSALAVLEPALTGRYPHSALYPAGGAEGSGVFSRYPITAEATWRGVFINQRVVVDWDGQPITLYNVHPPPPLGVGRFTFDERNAEIDAIITRADAEPAQTPLILTGDFNMGPRTPRYDALNRRFGDAWSQVGRGLGFTFAPAAIVPLFRIDYVWHNDWLRPLVAEVRPAGGSDHQPIYAELSLLQEPVVKFVP